MRARTNWCCTKPIWARCRSKSTRWRVQFEDTDSIRWTLRDITERKELDSLRDDLTAMIYHDLRSPLANIVSSLEILSGMIGEDESVRPFWELR